MLHHPILALVRLGENAPYVAFFRRNKVCSAKGHIRFGEGDLQIKMRIGIYGLVTVLSLDNLATVMQQLPSRWH